MSAADKPHRSLLALREPGFSFNDSTYSLVLSSLADTLSTNGTVTTSSTVPGPGALSGKAILALGKATLRGAEKLIIWRRLQAINTRFPHNDVDEFPEAGRIYEDVLELSRRDMYPDVLRSRALNIILVQIGSRQTNLLIKKLTTWDHAEVEILISDLTEILNPLRLFTARKTGKLSNQARAYQASLSSWDSHSLGPLVLFLRQLSRHSLVNSNTRISRIIMEGSAMDFLLHLYYSDFADPLRDPKISEDPRWSFHKLCETLLIACSRADQGRHVNHRRDRFYALWSMEQQHTPTELGNTLVERTEILKLMKPKYVISFIRLIYHTMDDWFLGESGKQLSIHDRVAFDLIELSGFPSMEPENNFLALWALQKIVSFSEIKISDVFQRYVTSRHAENLSGLMTCIFERISQLISMTVLDWKTFISRWYEPNLGPANKSVSRTNGMLEVIDCFIEVAERNPQFLDTIIEANILGLLRPFLEVELRMTSSPIAKHEGNMLMTFDDSDLVVLGLINEHGLMQLFNDPLFLYTRTRIILAHAFAVVLPRLKEISPSMFENVG